MGKELSAVALIAIGMILGWLIAQKTTFHNCASDRLSGFGIYKIVCDVKRN